MSQLWRFLYPNYRHCVDIYITDASVSTLSIQLLKNNYVTGMEIPIPKLPLLGRHIYITDASVSILSMQLLGHTYVLGMEILIPELPSLGWHIYHICVSLYAEHTIIGPHLWPTYGDSYTRIALVGSTYIYHRCVSLYAEHTVIGTHLCPRYGDSYTRITVIGSTYISLMCQSLCWAYNYWNTPMPQVCRFLYPNYRHWVDIYITDASVSMLSIQLLKHTYVPPMEISIPELPSLGRHIYHTCASFYAEHTIIGRHLCLSYGDSYTRNTVIGSTYISRISQSLCWACNSWNTPMPQVWRFLYPNYHPCADIYITDESVSMLSIQ